MQKIQWEYIFNPRLAIESLPYVLQGLGFTLLIAIVSMAIGLVISLFLALGRISQTALFQLPSRAYISFMRGVPVLVILFVLYFGFPLIGIEFTAVTAAIIGFSLNSAAYMAETNRAAIQAIDRGQWEAAFSLGLTYWQTFFGVILPQAVKIAVPSLINVFLDLIKGTSLAAMITVPELFQRAKIVGGRELDYMTMYISVAFIYWGICSMVEMIQNRLEKHLMKAPR